MSEQRFCLISDDDGHWYVCPADKQAEASAYFEATCEAESPRSPIRKAGPKMPKWLDEVGGAPSLVTFTGYTIE